MRRSLVIALLLAGCGPSFAPGLTRPGEAVVLRSSCPDDPALQAPEGGLCVNEVQSDNRSTFARGIGDFPSWIELYHRGDTAIDLRRVTLATRASEPVRLSGTILPGEHQLWTLGERGDLPLLLDADGDTLTLQLDQLAPDALVLGAMDADQGWARFPDGGFGRVHGLPTPAAANGSFPGVIDPSDRLFQRQRITPFAMTLTPDAYSALQSTQLFQKLEVEGGLSFDEGAFPAVGVRVKGGYGTFRNDLNSSKVSFKVDVNEFAPHRYRGLKALTFNGYAQDATATHEHLTYLVYRAAGLPASRTGFAQLSVNGVDFGLYVVVEAVDDQLLGRWFDDATGPMYEGAYGPDLTPGQVTSFEYDEGPIPPDFTPLAELADALEQPWDEATLQVIAGMVDLDQFTMYMAIEHAVWHWDGYTTRNNYRIYHDPSTDRFSFLPWGTDQTWIDAWPGAYESGGRLHDFCMAVPSCRALYSDQLRRLADLIEQLPLEAELDAVNAHIDAAWTADPRRSHSAETRAANVERTRNRIRELPTALRQVAE